MAAPATTTEPTSTGSTTAEDDRHAGSSPAERGRAAKAAKRKKRLLATVVQIVLVVGFLAAWEWLPQIQAVADSSRFLDPFFISSPSEVAKTLRDLMTGSDTVPAVWSYLWPTLGAALIGAGVGMLAGAITGLICSNFEFVNMVFHPFLVALNAVPRIALIPVLVILFGITFTTSVVASILVVFFVVFFNAYEGGRTVAPVLLHNAEVLGANPWQRMRYIRAPYVLAWTFASLPLAMTFSLLSVVTAEVLTGYAGIGRLLSTSISTSQPSLTFSVVIVLGVVGLIVVGVSQFIKKRVLHWWSL